MKLFRRLRRKLAKELPPCLPTRVYIVPRKRIDDQRDAMTHRTKAGFVIKLASDRNEQTLCDCLVHEWAHAVAAMWEGDEHPPAWGIVYAAAWTIFDKMPD